MERAERRRVEVEAEGWGASAAGGAGKGGAAARAYAGVEGAVDALVAAREALASGEREVAGLERAAGAGDEAAAGRARGALGWLMAAARQSVRDAEGAAAGGEEEAWVREEAARLRGLIAVLEVRVDGATVDAAAPACEAAGDGLSIEHLVAADGAEGDASAGSMAALEAAARAGEEREVERAFAAFDRAQMIAAAELAAAEAAAYALPEEERVAALARIAGARSVVSVRTARAREIMDERATSGRARLVLSRDRVEFPDTEVGSESPAEPLWIRNDGVRAVALDQLAGPEEFPVYGLCGVALEPRDVAKVEVGFRPGAAGRQGGTLTLETDGGVRSAHVLVRGRGLEPGAAAVERARVERAATQARGGDPLPLPRTFVAMRDLLRAGQQLEAVGDRDGAFRALVAVRDSLREVANSARAREVFSRFGFGGTGLDHMRGAAVEAVRSLVDCLVGHYPMLWQHRLAAFDHGQEAIELLTGERDDSPGARAMHAAAKEIAKLAALPVVAAAAAAAPVLGGELALIGRAGLAAWRSSYLWGAANPATAVAVSSAATGVAIDMADKGGPAAWLESASTLEGGLGLAFDLLNIHDAQLTGRSGRAAAPADETIECRRGEAAARVGELRRAGGELASDGIDAGGARVYRVRTAAGSTIDLVEPASTRPAMTRPAPLDRARAVWLQVRAAAAGRTLEARDSRLARDIDAVTSGEDVLHLFDRVIVGGGQAAVIDHATLPKTRAASDGDGGLPGVIAASQGGETFGERKNDLGQPPDALAHDAHGSHQPGDLSARAVEYTPARAFTSAIALTRVESGLATLRGFAIVAVDTGPDPSWPVAGARVRLTGINACGETRRLYARATDIVLGPGPGRRLEDTQVAAHFRERLEADGRMVYGDEVVGRPRQGGRILVSGGGGTGGWNAADAAATGAEVDWVSRSATPRDEDLKAELADVQARLNQPDLPPDERARLEVRQVDLQSFSPAMLDRNLGGAGAFAQANVHRHSKEIASVTPSEDMTAGPFAGRPGKVHVAFGDGSAGWYDQVVIAHGLDATRPGGTVALTRHLSLHLHVASGYPVIQTPDASVRVLGAATWSPDWEKSLRDDYQTLTNLNAKRSKELSPFSRGIPESIEMAGRQISAANAELGDD